MMRSVKQKNKWHTGLYTVIGVSVLFVAEPYLPKVSHSVSGMYSLLWIGFALLVVGANLWVTLGVDHERRADLGSGWSRRRSARRLTQQRADEASDRQFIQE